MGVGTGKKKNRQTHCLAAPSHKKRAAPPPGAYCPALRLTAFQPGYGP